MGDLALEIAAKWAGMLAAAFEPYFTGGNLSILLGTWALTEVVAGPAVDALVMARRFVRWRLRLYAQAPWAKRLAAFAWCSAAVWFPGAQPPLCSAGGDDCQTVFARVTTGAVLATLTVLVVHPLLSAGVRKLRGGKLVAIVCANCGAKAKVESLDVPCPGCGQPPHEVTRS